MAEVIRFGGFQLNNRWDDEEATGLLRAALAEIDALSDKLSPALLDEFERDVGSAFLRQDLPAIKATCEGYQRRFRALAKEAKYHRHNSANVWTTWSSSTSAIYVAFCRFTLTRIKRRAVRSDDAVRRPAGRYSGARSGE